MQEKTRRASKLLSEEGISQADLAELAGVSQSTVSRLVAGLNGKQHGKARRKLLEYIREGIPAAPKSREDAKKRLIVAFLKVWDETPEHADLIIRTVLHVGKGSAKARRRIRR